MFALISGLIVVALAVLALVFSPSLRNTVHVGALGDSHRVGGGGAHQVQGNWCPSDKPLKYLAFRQLIPAGAQITIVRQPQEAFTARRFTTASSIGVAFTVDSIAVGTREQNVDPGNGFLAQIASEANGGMEVCFNKVCEPGIQTRVQVTNITASDVFFDAVMTGPAEQTC